MGIPVIEADALAMRFIEGFKNAKAPYYGVNIIDVNNENWDAFIYETKLGHMGVVEYYGGRSHHWSVRDYGDRKRVLWINYYPENIGHLNSREFWWKTTRKTWLRNSALTERWDWYITSDVPEGAPI